MSLMLSQRRNGRGGGRIFSLGIVCVGLVALLLILSYRDGSGSTSLRAMEFTEERPQSFYRQTFEMIREGVGMTVPPAKHRQYPILEPKTIAGASKIVGPVASGVSPELAGYSSGLQKFVKAENTGLTLDGEPFVINGFNNYYLVTRAAWVEEGRKMVDEVFESAKELGANTLRIWGFVDGDEWNALQPEQGLIDEAMFREGLDYVVSKAAQHEIRLIIVLTNYNPGYGGMEQYVKWANKTSISSFYTDAAIKEAFKDYICTVVNRKSAVDEVLYKDNPAILGWELANEPKDPGNPQSAGLQGWIEEMSQYLKQLDKNHLVLAGSAGFFGPSTPDRVSANPYTQVFNPLVSSPFHYDAVCEGEDFSANQAPDTVDVAATSLFPDNWLACDQACKLQWSKEWIRHHLEAAAAIGRPLLITAFGSQKPIETRNEFIKMVHDELMSAINVRYPVAGSLAWILNADEYPDYDGLGIYFNNETAVSQPRPDWPFPNSKKEVEANVMRNREAMLRCIGERTQSLASEDGQGWNDGWEETANIISEHAKDLRDLAVRKEVHPEA